MLATICTPTSESIHDHETEITKLLSVARQPVAHNAASSTLCVAGSVDPNNHPVCDEFTSHSNTGKNGLALKIF